MFKQNKLPRAFYNRPALQVAPDLLGKRLVRIEEGQRISGIILETEAYRGEDDLGCHCRAGRTPRTQVMYGPPGQAYVYFTYGMHWMLNFVVEAEDQPAAILIRAIYPTEGLDIIAARRGTQPKEQWTNGPAKLCQALNINGNYNGIDLCTENTDLFVEDAFQVPQKYITNSPRVGLNNVPEPWKSIPWRFRISRSYADRALITE
jgi:DNA-3-methyladenine glycosylase